LVPGPVTLKKTIAHAFVQTSDKVRLRSKYKPLLEDERVRKWVRGNSRKFLFLGPALTASFALVKKMAHRMHWIVLKSLTEEIPEEFTQLFDFQR
jgi:hypothetical protein